MTILEPAALPQRPWRPAYALDAALSLVGSLALGMFAVWFVEFFAPRSPPEPAVILRESWPALPYAQEARHPGPAVLAANAPLQLPIQEAPPHEPAAEAGPRELSDVEIVRILRAAGDDAKLAILALLMGVDTDELLLLRWGTIDFAGGIIAIPGQAARTMRIEGPLRHHLADRVAARPAATGPLLQNAGGDVLSVVDLENLVTYAAYDAALDRAEAVTPAALRHTYILYLLRQGIRLSDIGRIVGRIPREDLLAYMRVGSPEMRLPVERIERVPPALRDFDRPAPVSGSTA